MTARRSPLSALTIFGVGTATLVAATLPFVATPAIADGSTAAPSYGTTESAQAVSTGTPVVVNSLTTESSQVTAEPDGSFQLTADSGPVRAMTSNGWSPIDTTLTANSDGTFSPNVVTTPLRFSGGGTAPMVSIGTSQQGIDTSWPTALPTPTVSGNTVTYPSVRPDVDLVLTAQATGFTETLVVKNAAAASSLNANPVVLSAVGHGVTVSQNGTGSIVGTDPSGTTVFDSSTPTAWDSSVVAGDPNEHATVLTAANAVVAKLGQILTPASAGSHVTLSVPSALMNSGSTVYPVFVDPEIDTLPAGAFQTVQSGGWNYGTGSSEPMRVGYCGWSGCTSVEGNARSYFNFDTRAMRRQQVNSTTQEAATVFDANVSVRESWNAESYATPVNLTQSGSFSSSTTYPGPYSSTLQQLSSNCGWNNANYCNLNFNAQAVADYAQSAATNDWQTLTFALSAPSENNAAYWKKFDSGSTLTTLTVDYNYTPGTPTTPVVTGAVTCPNKTTVTYVNTVKPQIKSSAISYSGANTTVNLNFTALGHPTSDPNLTVNGTVPNLDGNPAAIGTWTPTLQNNVAYSVRDYASNVWKSSSTGVNNELDSAWTPYVNFTVDTNRPATPSIQSFAYPNYASGYWGATQDKPGTFTLTGDPSIAGFAYSDTNTMPSLVPGNCTYDQTATPTSGFKPANGGIGQYTPPTTVGSGLHDLYVWAITNAHNVSLTPAHYRYYITPQYSVPSGTSGGDSTLYEAENMPVTANQTGTSTFVDNSPTSSAASASGAADVQLVSSTTAQQTAPSTFTFTLSPKVSGYAALGVELLTDTHNATLSFKINGSPVQDPQLNAITQDTCSTTSGVPQQNVFVPLGGFNLDNTKVNTLTITMTGTTCGSTTASDGGYSAGVDYVTISPLSPVSGSLQSAFNNHGIGIDNATTNLASLDQTTDPATGYNALSKQALSGVNYYPSTSTQTNTFAFHPTNGTGDVTFTLQAPNAAGNDNVIAAGQNITMPGNVVGNAATPGYVDLLVASTCGGVPENPGYDLGMTFDDGTGPYKLAPNLDMPILNWTDTASPNQGTGTGDFLSYLSPVTTNYYLTSSTSKQALNAGAQIKASLYVLQIPIPHDYATKPLTAITLPSIGTDFTNTCSKTNNALHVFAVSTSTD